jgi:hypothetical protein
LSDVYKKMEVGSRSEATRKALREEWITIMDVTQENEWEESGQLTDPTS